MTGATAAWVSEASAMPTPSPYVTVKASFHGIVQDSLSAELRFFSALRGVDLARTREALDVARTGFMALGPEAVQFALRELQSPQSSRRGTVLRALVRKRAEPSHLIALATNPEQPARQREELAGVLGEMVEELPGLKNAIATTLLSMTRHPELSVRVAAIDALGASGVKDESIISALREFAEGPNLTLRQVAAEALEDLE